MTSLDSSSLKFFDWVSFWGFAVAIVGVIGEGAEYLVKWTERRHFRKAFPRSSRRDLVEIHRFTKPRLLRVETAFFVLLVGGLAFEFWGSENANRILSQYNAELHDRATQAELKIEEMRKQAEPRADRLRQSDFHTLAKENPSGEVEILYAPYNGEAAEFAAELHKELEAAGWKMLGVKPKPADLEPTWDSPRPRVPESFASIAIVSHSPSDEEIPRLQKVPFNDGAPGLKGSNDTLILKWDFSGNKPKVKEVDRYHFDLPPAGIGAKFLASALEKSGFRSERNVDTNTPPGKILVVIGAKE
jgi:hypothetical protein